MTVATWAGLGAIALWGLLALFTTATAGIPPFEVTAITFAVGGGLGLLITAARGELRQLAQPPQAWLLGVGGLFGYHALYFAALKLAPPAEASLLAYLWPLLIVLFTAFLPGESLRGKHVVGALLGFAGVGVIAVAKGAAFSANALPGYGLGLACAFVWAGYSVLLRRMANVPTVAVTGFCLATALLALLCHHFFEQFVMPSAAQWLALLALGIGPVGAAFFLWDFGMKRGDIRFLGVASYAAPVTSTLALVATGATSATWTLWAACALIVAGALVATRKMPSSDRVS